MSRNQTSCKNHVDEDYIDMELSSSSNFISISIGSPPQTREFEFQMTSSSNKKEPTNSPADELFYKGKLLPLHLPPRLKMVQNLLQGSNPLFEQLKTDSYLEESCSFPLNNDLNVSHSTYSFSYLETCRISPPESCRVSCELNPEESLLQWSTEMSGFLGENIAKKFWSRKLKQIKQSLLGSRLKASKAYIKSLFNKSGCSAKSCSNADAEDSRNDHIHCKNADRKSQFEAVSENRYYHRSLMLLKAINREMLEDGVVNNQRKSFSGAIQRHSTTKSLSSSTSSTSSSCSSSFSFSSKGFSDFHLFKRSVSANSETESSIEEAIAHCKQSQQPCNSIAIANEAKVY